MGACCTKNLQFSGKAAVETSRSGSRKHNDNEIAPNDDLGIERRKESTHQEASERVSSVGLKKFTLAELKRCTMDFAPETLLGEGGYGWVFKGWVDLISYAPSDETYGMPIAVKMCKLPNSERGLKQWQTEVKLLGKFVHQNLVKLLGYCYENKELLLVYEYMQNGSLESHLFKNDEKLLSWHMRLKIATEAARGLAFLHTTENQVIYRDFKTSNILLDEDFNAKLSDFGLAKFGPPTGKSHVTTEVYGTSGFRAPEYVDTGHLYVKSDVYGFGVMLLELLTGLPVVDMRRPTEMQNMVKLTQSLLAKKDIANLIDPNLKDKYPPKTASEFAKIIEECLRQDHKSRPSMEEVLDKLEQIKADEDFEGQNFVWRIF